MKIIEFERKANTRDQDLIDKKNNHNTIPIKLVNKEIVDGITMQCLYAYKANVLKKLNK